MPVSDPMPKDKRTRAYKDWLKREMMRQRLAKLEGSVSLRFLPIDPQSRGPTDIKAYNKVVMELIELQFRLLKDYSTELLAVKGMAADAKGQTVIRPDSTALKGFYGWLFLNNPNPSGTVTLSSTVRNLNWGEILSRDQPLETLKENLAKNLKQNKYYLYHQIGIGSSYGYGRNQPCWSVVPNNSFMQWPQGRNSYNQKQNLERAGVEVEYSNRWYPINPTQTPNSRNYNPSLGVFPPTFWPSEFGKLPSDRDELIIGMMTWLDDLINTYWTSPSRAPIDSYGSKMKGNIACNAVAQYNSLMRNRNQRNGAEQIEYIETWEDFTTNEHAEQWLEKKSMGIRLEVLFQMIMSNKLYELQYQKPLSAFDQWVVLHEPSLTGNEEEYGFIPQRNLVMPLERWAEVAVETYSNMEGFPTVKQILSEGPVSIKNWNESFFDNFLVGWRGSQTNQRSQTMELFALADDTVYSFENPISSDVFEECYRDWAKIWRDDQTSRVEEANEGLQTTIAETDKWLKETSEKIAKAEPLCYVHFKQQYGPRGGKRDGESASFSIQLKPRIKPEGASSYGPPWGYTPTMYTEKQIEALNNLWTQLYEKYASVKIATNPDEVRFIRNKKQISYEEARKIKSEDRSYGSVRKYNALERVMAGRGYRNADGQYVVPQKTWAEMFYPIAERKLIGLIGRDKVTKAPVAPNEAITMPTEISDAIQLEVDTDTIVKLKASYNQDVNREAKVQQAKKALADAEKAWKAAQKRLKAIRKTKLTPSEQAVLMSKYKANPTTWAPLLTTLGIELPATEEDDTN